MTADSVIVSNGNFHLFSRLKQSAILLATMIISNLALCQQKSFIGLDQTLELSYGGYVVPGTGATFESRFGQHAGLETGLFYRQYRELVNLYVNGFVFVAGHYKPTYLSVPVLYKWHSSLLNFSVGPSFDIYLGTKNIFRFPTNTYNRSLKKFNVGAVGKLSKTLSLTNRFLLEPEIRFNHLFTNHRTFAGIGIAGKWAL